MSLLQIFNVVVGAVFDRVSLRFTIVALLFDIGFFVIHLLDEVMRTHFRNRVNERLLDPEHPSLLELFSRAHDELLLDVALDAHF